MGKKKVLKVFSLFYLAFLLACSSGIAPSDKQPFRNGERPFSEYVIRAEQHITENRSFVTDIKDLEISYNIPYELEESCFEASETRKGILLVHGILDSPGYIIDVANYFADHCYLVRSILLDGAGTHPSHLMRVESEDWINAVSFRFKELQQEVDEVFLGGFSLGGALVTNLAFNNNASIKGLFLIAPSLELYKSQKFSSNFAVFLDIFSDYITPVEREKNPVKYHSFAYKALYNLKDVQALIKKHKDSNKKIAIPTFFVFSHDDPAVPSQSLVENIHTYFTHERNEALIFAHPGKKDTYRQQFLKISYLNSYFPEKKIVNFSHTCLTNSPSNPLFGEEGAFSFCVETSAIKEEDFQKCLNNKDLVTFGAREEGNPYRSVLTYNPHFNEMMDQVIEFFEY